MNNIFKNLPENPDNEIFETLAASDSIQIERIISRGHTSPAAGWYNQARNEWVIILKGEAVILFADGSSYQMKAGDYLNIPAHTRHRVKWTRSESETIWLAVHY